MSDEAAPGHPSSALASADALTWRKLSDSGPFRTARWVAFIIFFGIFWCLNGTPRTAAGWIPVLIAFVIAFLPDAKRVSFGGMSWEAREQIEATRRELAAIRLDIHVGERAGEAAIESAQARTAPAQPIEKSAWRLSADELERLRQGGYLIQLQQRNNSTARPENQSILLSKVFTDNLERLSAERQRHIATAVARILTEPGIPVPLTVPGDPPGTQYYAIVPHGDLTPVPIYRDTLDGEDGRYLVTTLMDRQSFNYYLRNGADPVVRGVAASVAVTGAPDIVYRTPDGTTVLGEVKRYDSSQEPS